MAPLDAGSGLPDVSADQPSGENLEFDADFIELERLSQGKPEQQYGSTIIPAEEPDWRAVAIAAEALLERTHDLRVMAHLGVARLRGAAGVSGYAGVLALVRGELETRWATVHPQLDPDDDNDPMLRANALLRLCEPGRVMLFLRQLPLAQSPRAGRITWRDISVANGTAEASEQTPKVTDAAVVGAFRETDATALALLGEAVQTALDAAQGVVAAFDENAGFGTGPDYTELVKLLREMASMIARYTPAVAMAEEAGADITADTGGLEPGIAPVTAARASAPVMSIATMGPPTSRADAMRLLDLVVEFYERNEPSSPLPLLITRARRLAAMSFMDILRDMAPDGLNQAERIAGVQES